MKYAISTLLVILVLALTVAGCGKSDAFKKMEAELNAQVMKMHEAQMNAVGSMKDLASQIDATVASHEELGKKYAKQMAGHSTDDLIAAKEKLMTVQTEMDVWMKGFKKYDEKAKHEDVMAQLNKHKDELTAMQKNIDEAMTAAKTAVDSHTQFAADLVAKAKPGKKK